MEIRFNITGAERKKLVIAVSELLNEPLNYKGAPTFAYGVGSYNIDRLGTLAGPDNRGLVADLAGLCSYVPTEETYDAAPEENSEEAPPIISFGEGCQRDPDHDYYAEGPQASDCENQDTLTIEMPLDGFTEEAIVNLGKLVASKASLIMKAIGADALPIERTETTLQFPWFGFCEDSATTLAYSQFITALCAAAKQQKRVNAKEKDVENEKFTLRVFLIRLGFIGDDYKAARKILLKNLTGNSAYAK